MVSRIFRFNPDGSGTGSTVLGFDTGLDNQAFAQAKMAQFMTQYGFIVFPDGTVKKWKAESLTEVQKDNGSTIVIWGPDFPGESLDVLVRDTARRETALDAIRFYLNARQALGNEAVIYPGASGVFVQHEDGNPDFPRGTVMFPPERLTKRSVEAGGGDEVINAQQWVHPDLQGDESTVFTAAVMLYAVLSGEMPFLPKDGETLRQDIREGVFIPLRLAAPGLTKERDELITCTLLPEKKKEKMADKKRPSLECFIEIAGRPGSAGSPDWFAPVADADREKMKAELGQYRKKKEFTVKTRRFVVRNTAILTGCLIALVAIGLSIRGYMQRLEEMPTTAGMTPTEIAAAYYDSFGSMNHEMMEACVTGKEAKMDVDMIVNLYVITKTRQAYESNFQVSMTAQEWLDKGSPQTDITVFGITDLEIRNLGLNETSGEVLLEADYKLWMPATFAGDDTEMPTDEEIFSGNYVTPPPKSYGYNDLLHFSWIDERWRITEIERTVG